MFVSSRCPNFRQCVFSDRLGIINYKSTCVAARKDSMKKTEVRVTTSGPWESLLCSSESTVTER